MLKRNEEAVLNTILNNAYKNESCLITLPNIVAFIGNEKLVSNDNIKNIIEKLSASDYIDFLVVKVKNDIGTREIYICESCKRQYEENSES